MRALIDILNDENNIIERITRLERDLGRLRQENEEIERFPKERGADSFILNRLTEISNKRAAIHCDLIAEKTKLHHIHNEIRCYFQKIDFHIGPTDDVDVMPDGN